MDVFYSETVNQQIKFLVIWWPAESSQPNLIKETLGITSPSSLNKLCQTFLCEWQSFHNHNRRWNFGKIQSTAIENVLHWNGYNFLKSLMGTKLRAATCIEQTVVYAGQARGLSWVAFNPKFLHKSLICVA